MVLFHRCCSIAVVAMVESLYKQVVLLLARADFLLAHHYEDIKVKNYAFPILARHTEYFIHQYEFFP